MTEPATGQQTNTAVSGYKVVDRPCEQIGQFTTSAVPGKAHECFQESLDRVLSGDSPEGNTQPLTPSVVTIVRHFSRKATLISAPQSLFLRPWM